MDKVTDWGSYALTLICLLYVVALLLPLARLLPLLLFFSLWGR